MNLENKIKKIFIVDDDKVYLEGLKEFIKNKISTEVECFSTISECVKRVEETTPDLIIMDFHLSTTNNQHNGLWMLQKIKNINKAIPIVMLTRENNLQLAVDSMRHGAFDFIQKGDHVFRKLEKVFERLNEKIQNRNSVRRGYTIAAAVLATLVATSLVIDLFTSWSL
ncbi:MAG: response regulator [Flavobacteriales bacterium]|nr:response regulator [Flavobacteriales bacterium]